MSMQASAGDGPGADEFERNLLRQLYRFDCPDAHTLGEYELSMVDPVQRTMVAAHANECDECRAELHTLREFFAQPLDVPMPLMERARRVVATLFAPAPGAALSGVRGGPELATRTYEVDDVSVTVGEGQGPGSLMGLVLVESATPDELVGRTVRLISSGGAALTSTVGDLGNFEFEGVAPGEYALELELPGTVVVVEALRVG